MDITIEGIDANAMKPLGFTQLPSYPVQFSSEMVCGSARFVPFGDDVQEYLGRTLYVELSQERVTGVERLEPGHRERAVRALEARGTFQVTGAVGSVHSVAEPHGTVTVSVAAGAAQFLLSDKDFPGLSLQEGDTVTFRVHGLSLWDEQI